MPSQDERPLEDPVLLLQSVDLRCDPLRKSLDLCHGLARDLWLRPVVKLDVLRCAASSVRHYIKSCGYFDHRVSLADHFEQTLNQSLGFIHLLVAGQQLNCVIWISDDLSFSECILVLNLYFPFFLQTKTKHEGFERIESESIQVGESVVLHRVLARHFALQLVHVVLALYLTQNLDGRFLDNLFFLDLVPAILFCHLGSNRCHQSTSTNCGLLLRKRYIIKDRTKGPIS